MTNLEHLLGQEWEIVPAGGATGEAFIASHAEQKLFLKRNSSPFLAVLSAEGIVPKLVWTKRLENGDVISAQQWLEGRELAHREMNDQGVAQLLRKIHCSKPLLSMLERLGMRPLKPFDIIMQIDNQMDQDLANHEIMGQARAFLNENIDLIFCHENVVCHSDVNHNNWLLSDEEELYLIDWDGAMIADPAIDLGMLLYSYVPKEEWASWLAIYGEQLSDGLLLRMKWYVIAQTILSIQWYHSKQRQVERDNGIEYLISVLKL